MEVELDNFEGKRYSQNGEDGVLRVIFDLIGTVERYYVEFGVGDGSECNTRNLRERYWFGLMMDREHEDLNINLRREFVTGENVVELFQEYDVPLDFDLLSVDMDFNDFYVLRAILSGGYRPRVVVVEYNSYHPPDKDCVVEYDPSAVWDGTNYFGASILSYFRLGRANGYSLVYAERMGVNLFFVRDDCLERSGVRFLHMNDVEKIYRSPGYGDNGHPVDPKERPFRTSGYPRGE